MKLSVSTAAAFAAAAVFVEAAPHPVVQETAIEKREKLENALIEFEQMYKIRAKRDEIANELTEREYAIVTQVLTAIKDTDLAPVVLKFFVSNDTLKNLTIEALEFVIKSGFISLQSLLLLLVKSGLITDVIQGVLSDCEVYVSIIGIVEQVAKGLLSKVLSKRGAFSHEEGLELLKKDGLIEPSVFDNFEELEKRDIDDVIVNVLESLGQSGLATQVVTTILTDPDFISFGAELVKQLYLDGLIHISLIVSAVASSGLLPALLQSVLNISTLKEIFENAVDAFDGTCSGSGSLGTATKTTAAAVSTGTSSPLLLGSLGILGSLAGLVGGLLGSGSGSAGTTTRTTAATVAAVSTAINPCLTQLAKRERLRLY